MTISEMLERLAVPFLAVVVCWAVYALDRWLQGRRKRPVDPWSPDQFKRRRVRIRG